MDALIELILAVAVAIRLAGPTVVELYSIHRADQTGSPPELGSGSDR
jgi:hypothetical protein